MSVHIEGFDELQDKVDELQERTRNLDGKNEIPMGELFRPDFMRSYTEFESIEEFFDESPWELNSQEDFKEIPEDEFDKYVDEHTGFNSWEVMLKTAGREWVARQLSLE